MFFYYNFNDPKSLVVKLPNCKPTILCNNNRAGLQETSPCHLVGAGIRLRSWVYAGRGIATAGVQGIAREQGSQLNMSIGNEYNGIDQILKKRIDCGKPVMPLLLHYFDDELFDVYAGLYNAVEKPVQHKDQFEITLARSILTESCVQSNPNRKLIKNIIRLIANQCQ